MSSLSTNVEYIDIAGTECEVIIEKCLGRNFDASINIQLQVEVEDERKQEFAEAMSRVIEEYKI